MSQTLEINGIELWAYHGCLDEEAMIGGRYRVDVHFVADLAPSALTDDLALTIDYVRVVEVVRQEMAIRAKLIETVAQRITQKLGAEFGLAKEITVRLTKYAPPVNGPLESSVVIWRWAKDV